MDYSEQYRTNTGRIVEWQRATGVDQVAILSNDPRPYMYPSPLLRQNMTETLDYPCNEELAISMTLCRRLWRSHAYVEVLTKQAFWFIKHLAERTDLVEEGVPIRLCITRDIEDVVLPYAQRCNFPVQNIDWIESREAVYPQSTKFLALKHPSLANYGRVLNLSLCFLMDTHPTQHKGTWFKNLKEMWTTEPYCQPRPFILTKTPKTAIYFEERVMDEYNRLWGAEVPPEGHLLWQTLSEYLGEPAYDLKQHFLKRDGEIIDIRGSCFGFTREQIDKLDLERDFFPVQRVSNDEVVLEAYAYREGWGADDACDIESAFRWLEANHPVEPHTEYGIRYVVSQITEEAWMEQYK